VEVNLLSSYITHTRRDSVPYIAIGSPSIFVVGFFMLVILPLTTLLLYEIFKKKARDQ